MKVRTWYAAGLLILVLVHLNARGQSTGPKSNAPKKAPSKASAAKPKLTDEQQRGLDMLKAANAKAGALNLAMRAAVMWQAAHGYAKVDHDQLRVKLKDAFRAAASAEDDTRTCTASSNLIRAMQSRGWNSKFCSKWSRNGRWTVRTCCRKLNRRSEEQSQVI
jgi:hypothetical protein